MGISYKSYADTKNRMKKYVTVTEGSLIDGISRNHLLELVIRADAYYKVGKINLINMELFEEYLEQFHEAAVPLPKHICRLKE